MGHLFIKSMCDQILLKDIVNRLVEKVFKFWQLCTYRKMIGNIQNFFENGREWMLERFQKTTETYVRHNNYEFWQYENHAEEIYPLFFL